MSGKKGLKEGWCIYCGTQAPSGSHYCPRCGEPLVAGYVYDEIISPEEAVAEEGENPRGGEITLTPRPPAVRESMGIQVLYEGTIRGLVTRESRIILASVLADSGVNLIFANNPSYAFAEVYFVMRLEEDFEGVPDEILVHTKFGYFGIGDKVILKGRIIKINLKQWNRPMYAIFADHFYNESLQIGDERLMGSRQVLYKGTIRGSVTRESRTRIANNGHFVGTYFAMKLEENIGIEGIHNVILVRSYKAGYFRIGDKVILQGRLLKINIKRWNRPMYILLAVHFYNESLQTGDEGVY